MFTVVAALSTLAPFFNLGSAIQPTNFSQKSPDIEKQVISLSPNASATKALRNFAKRITWYGPEKISFHLKISGNPYNPSQNDVRVKFISPNHTTERLAYWDGAKWNAILLTRYPGKYQAKIVRNGKIVDALSQQILVGNKLKMPFVEIANDHFDFATEDGKPFWPVGHDLGWHNQGDPLTVPDQIDLMGKKGLNWARVWACFFDDKCPWWNVPIGQLSQKSYTHWDHIFKAGQLSGVRIQMTLFHHGEVSSLTDPNWSQNPWNLANGGFLAKPQDFFTNPRAISLCKEYLRYDVARYAAMPSLFAWEIFNEVQWSNTAHDGHWGVIARWHKIMADYIRSIDPYHHPVTSSSNLPANVNASLDIIEQHGYPASVETMLLADKPPHDKPYFYAEVGPNGSSNSKKVNLDAARDGLWGGVLACDSASGMYWYWDRVSKMGFYPEYKFDTHVLFSSGFLNHPDRHPFELTVRSAGRGNLSFAPGQGWANGKQLNFSLPTDYENGSVGEIATFFQGTGHANMKTGPLSFQFESPTSGEFHVTIVQEAKSGAHLVFSLNGDMVQQMNFPPASTDQSKKVTISIPFEAGPNKITMANTGNDWVVVSNFTITGIGPAVTGHAMGDRSFALARLEASKSNAKHEVIHLSGLPLADGVYKLTLANLNSHTETDSRVTVENGEVESAIHLTDSDVIAILKRK